MKKIMIYSLIALSLLVIISVTILILLSPGKPKPFLDSDGKTIPNSISEKLFIKINGSKQGLFIKGKNIQNPVVLYLHGGMPDYFLTEKYPSHLEDVFTVIWWEQRNCGISANLGTSGDKAIIEQLIDDAIELTKYLSKRFKKEKIYLMGHSGGTFLCVNIIEKAPKLFEAYIGVAQMSDQITSEKIALDYILKALAEKGDNKMLENFKNISIEKNKKIPIEYLKKRDPIMHELGIGTLRSARSIFSDIFLQSILFSEYTILEKFKLWQSKSSSGISQNWDAMINTNLIESKYSFQVPVYFFHGIYDYTCSHELAKKYFEKIDAPVKGFYTFYESAHSPMFEEPYKMKQIIVNDVLKLKSTTADKSD